MSFEKKPHTTIPGYDHSPKTNEWLARAIASKSDSMIFAPPSARDLESDALINMTRFGFKFPKDLEKFLLSPAGETVEAEIGAREAQNEAIKEQQKQDQIEKNTMEQRIKVHILLWLMSKQAHADDQLRELINEQNAKTMEQIKESSQQYPKSHQENKATEQALASYDSAIQEYLAEHNKLNTTEMELTEQLENLIQQRDELDAKHALYTESLENFALESEEHELLPAEELDTKILEMEEQLAQQTKKIMDTLDSEKPGSEEAARKLVHQQNTLNLKLASLYDLRSKQKGEKFFFNQSGEQVMSQKEAAFIMNFEQHSQKKIVEKDGKHYLIAKDKDFSELSEGEKGEAESDFSSLKHELMSVKKAVENTIKLEKQFHNFDARIKDTTKERETATAQKTELQNQIRLLQSVQATLMKQSAESGPDTAPKPTPTVSNKAGHTTLPPVPASFIAFSKGLFPSIFKTPGLSSQHLFDQADKKAKNSKNPKEAQEIKDYLKKVLTMLGLGKIPSMAPLPHTTMESLLKYMAQFGADPYKPGLTPMQSPMDSKSPASKPKMTTPVKQAPEPEEEPRPQFNPSPMKNRP